MTRKVTNSPSDAEKTLTVLCAIENHLGILVRCQLQPIYAALIHTPELQKLYEQTGKVPVAKLSQAFGVSTGKISMLWQKWEQAGLLIKEGSQYRQTL